MDISDSISSALADDIKELSTDLEQSRDQVDQSLATLRRDLRLAVRSSLGLTIIISFENQPVTLTSLDHLTVGADIATSLKLPLPPTAPTEDGSITFYAGVPGAFVDLAADLAHSLDLPDDLITLDDDLDPSTTSGLAGVDEFSTINRAIGVLLERGTHLISTDPAGGARAAESLRPAPGGNSPPRGVGRQPTAIHRAENPLLVDRSAGVTEHVRPDHVALSSSPSAQGAIEYWMPSRPN